MQHSSDVTGRGGIHSDWPMCRPLYCRMRFQQTVATVLIHSPFALINKFNLAHFPAASPDGPRADVGCSAACTHGGHLKRCLLLLGLDTPSPHQWHNQPPCHCRPLHACYYVGGGPGTCTLAEHNGVCAAELSWVRGGTPTASGLPRCGSSSLSRESSWIIVLPRCGSNEGIP